MYQKPTAKINLADILRCLVRTRKEKMIFFSALTPTSPSYKPELTLIVLRSMGCLMISQ